MSIHELMRLRDPDGRVRVVRYARAVKTGRVFVYVRTGMFRTKTVGGWDLLKALDRLVYELGSEGWEVVS